MALILQDPAPLKLTIPPAIEQTEDEVASIVIATVRPEVEVALGVYVLPPTVPLDGAEDM